MTGIRALALVITSPTLHHTQRTGISCWLPLKHQVMVSQFEVFSGITIALDLHPAQGGLPLWSYGLHTIPSLYSSRTGLSLKRLDEYTCNEYVIYM